MGDETTKIFLSSKGDQTGLDRDVAAFLDYIEGRAPTGKFVQALAAETERVKEQKETRVEYMTYIMELRREKEEGREEGREGERLSNIRNLMKNTGATAEKAMEMLGIDKASVPKYLSLL